MEKLTFKQYLDSKEQLKQALSNTPKSIVEYNVRNYCSLYVGETREESKLVVLKPKQKIIVEWLYNNIDNPDPVYVKLKGVKDFDEDEEITMFWPGKKLQAWLARHTKKNKQLSNVSTVSKMSLGSAEAVSQQTSTGVLGNDPR